MRVPLWSRVRLSVVRLLLRVVSLRIKVCLLSVPMLRYNSQTYFWPERLEGRSEHSIPASVFFGILFTTRVLSARFGIFLSFGHLGWIINWFLYQSSVGRFTVVRFGFISTSRLMPSSANVARFTCVLHFSQRSGGFDETFSPKRTNRQWKRCDPAKLRHVVHTYGTKQKFIDSRF